MSCFEDVYWAVTNIFTAEKNRETVIDAAEEVIRKANADSIKL